MNHVESLQHKTPFKGAAIPYRPKVSSCQSSGSAVLFSSGSETPPGPILSQASGRSTCLDANSEVGHSGSGIICPTSAGQSGLLIQCASQHSASTLRPISPIGLQPGPAETSAAACATLFHSIPLPSVSPPLLA
ncbi:unnamed protein product, partial [Protopolystoma xenopodis]